MNHKRNTTLEQESFDFVEWEEDLKETQWNTQNAALNVDLLKKKYLS